MAKAEKTVGARKAPAKLTGEEESLLKKFLRSEKFKSCFLTTANNLASGLLLTGYAAGTVYRDKLAKKGDDDDRSFLHRVWDVPDIQAQLVWEVSLDVSLGTFACLNTQAWAGKSKVLGKLFQGNTLTTVLNIGTTAATQAIVGHRDFLHYPLNALYVRYISTTKYRWFSGWAQGYARRGLPMPGAAKLGLFTTSNLMGSFIYSYAEDFLLKIFP
jgi:hypothetical protein